MKINNKILKEIINDSINKILLEYDPGFGDYMPTPEDDTSMAEDMQDTVESLTIGLPIKKIFRKWKNAGKNKELIGKIISDSSSVLFFNGHYISWVGSDGSTYIKLPAGSGRREGLMSYLPIKSNFKEKMKIKNVGPAPEGKYIVQPPQKNKDANARDVKSLLGLLGFTSAIPLKALGVGKGISSGWGNVNWSIMSRATWGNYRALIKQIEGKTYNRSSMYIHGGTVQSSAGCIDLSAGSKDGMNILGPLLALWYAVKGNNRLKLVIKYPN